MSHPFLIQGGMGAGVSGWPLARAVSRQGQLGVVAGTALDVIVARRLQRGDPGGHVRRAAAAFPLPAIAERVLGRYFVDGGKAADAAYRSVPVHSLHPPTALSALTVFANFVEIYLAKEDHDGLVGVNYLEKIQLPTLASLYGAMLAGVDYVLMGAGIPWEIPGALDALAAGETASLRLFVHAEASGEERRIEFDPRTVAGDPPPTLGRPRFLAIVASTTLASALRKRATGRIDGFVVEGHVAGGHNAPPRGRLQLDESGQPIYGKRDEVDLEVFRQLDVPFWLAGAYGTPERLAEALAAGAAGVQVGTPFAFCEESGLAPRFRQRVLDQVRAGTALVYTDATASPTGFPFKVVGLEGSLSEPDVYAARPRVCDLGFLRTAYREADGSVGLRCPAEPVEDYVRKGGAIEETEGRRCLCNGLVANIGLAQVRDGDLEPPILTSGDDLSVLLPFLAGGRAGYRARDVVAHLCSRPSTAGEPAG